MTIGDKIRAKRLELGISQAALAQTIGMTQAGLSDIENNKTCWPGGGSIALLADALQVSTDYLLRNQEDDSDAPR